MEFIPIANTAQVNTVALWDGQEVNNVFHVTQPTPYDLTSLAVLGALFQGWLENTVVGGLPATISYQKIILRALDTEDSPALEYTTGFPLTGLSVSKLAMPNNVTVAVKWSTGRAGRSYRGRTFHIGLTEDYVTDNQLSAGGVAYLNTVYGDLLDAFDSYPGDLVVASRYHNNAPRVSGITTPIVSYSINPVIDSQRRRLPGRGR